MNCPKCNAVIDDDSIFCTHCGEVIRSEEKNEEVDRENEGTAAPDPAEGEEKEDAPEPAEGEEKETASKPAASKPGMEKFAGNKNKLIGLIIGTVLIAVGFYRISKAGTSISSESFGADFYTYTYQGIVAVSEILASIEVTLGWVIVAIGAAIDVLSLR